jgi:RNA-dependent RNA polymerase
MEVFMRNLHYELDELQLTRELEPILHGPQFQGLSENTPFNFIVRLLKGRRGHSQTQRNRGLGKLLLPSEVIGNRLLFLANTTPIVVRGRRIFMEKSRNNVERDDMVILKEPYQDPAVRGTQEPYRAENSGPIPMLITTVNFGWWCHDGKVSLEWSSLPTDPWEIEFLPDNHYWALRSRSGLNILIALKAVHSGALGARSCVFWLERAPIFEQNNINEAFDEENSMDELVEDFQATSISSKTAAKRNRLVTLDPKQKKIFAYLRVIQITFDTHHSVQEFRAKAQEIGLPYDAEYPDLVQRNLFPSTAFRYFHLLMVSLPYEIAFQLEALLSRCQFNLRELLELQPRLTTAMRQHPPSTISTCIRALEQRRDENPEASTIELFSDLVSAIRNDGQVKSFMQPTPDLFHCHHVTVTPTSLILQGPLPHETNRVIRNYADYTGNFMRVEFREEDRLQFRWDRDVDGDLFINERVGHILKEGIVVAGRKFEFLAYSSSALREHAVWFMTPFRTIYGEIVTPDSIRSSLGDFRTAIYCPALYGARISQAFSATEGSIYVEAEETFLIPDQQSPSGSCFTDGVGRVSPFLAEEMWRLYITCPSRRSRRRLQTPAAFQIRIGGVKGMLCVDHRLEGRAIFIRPSMKKFTSGDCTIEIAHIFDRPMLMYLDRPLIMLLETLGVPLQPFMELQHEAVEETERASESFESAGRLLEQHGLGTTYRMTSIMLQLHRLDAELNSTDQELVLMRFLKCVIKFSVNHILRDLKYEAKIPVKKAWTLVGVADEWNYLQEGEVFGEYAHVQSPKLV